MGIYWIAGAVVRSVQQVIINKQLDKIDFDAVIEKNKEKAKAKIQKQNMERMSAYANMNTRNISISEKANSAKYGVGICKTHFINNEV